MNSLIIREGILDCHELAKGDTSIETVLRVCRKLKALLHSNKECDGIMWCIMVSQNYQVLKHVSFSEKKSLGKEIIHELARLAKAAVDSLSENNVASDDLYVYMRRILDFCCMWNRTTRILWQKQVEIFKQRCMFLAVEARFSQNAKYTFQINESTPNLDKWVEMGTYLGLRDASWIQQLRTTQHMLPIELAYACVARTMLVDGEGRFPTPFENKRMHSVESLQAFEGKFSSFPREDRIPSVEECEAWNENIPYINNVCGQFIRRWNALCVEQKWVMCPITGLGPAAALDLVVTELLDAVEGKNTSPWWMMHHPFIHRLGEHRMGNLNLLKELQFKSCCGELGFCSFDYPSDELVRFQPCDETLLRDYYKAVMLDDVAQIHICEFEMPQSATHWIRYHADDLRKLARLQILLWH